MELNHFIVELNHSVQAHPTSLSMANTKKFTDRAMRKGIKRSQRKRLQTLANTLTPADRRKLRKEPQGIRSYVAATQAAAAAAAADAE